MSKYVIIHFMDIITASLMITANKLRIYDTSCTALKADDLNIIIRLNDMFFSFKPAVLLNGMRNSIGLNIGPNAQFPWI